MARKRKKIDNPNQLSLFDQIDIYVAARREILEKSTPSVKKQKNREHTSEEDCIALAVAVKKAIRESGMSREQVCDQLNDYWGLSEEGFAENKCKKPLSYSMINHHLSKPTEYPIPAYFLFAIHRVTGSLEPAKALVEPEGAEVASSEDIAMMALGKLDQNITEMQQLKRQLKKAKINNL